MDKLQVKGRRMLGQVGLVQDQDGGGGWVLFLASGVLAFVSSVCTSYECPHCVCASEDQATLRCCNTPWPNTAVSLGYMPPVCNPLQLFMRPLDQLQQQLLVPLIVCCHRLPAVADLLLYMLPAAADVAP
jgi:hypothetical protein